MATISTKWLNSAADQLERDANESLQAWMLLGTAQRYFDSMAQVDMLRKAAGIKSIAARRTYLIAHGVAV
jgi:hypothetical protein